MKRFRFTLETLLKKEQFEEKQRLEALSEIRMILEKAIGREAAILIKIEAARNKHKKSGITVDKLKDYSRYMKDLMQKRKEAEENIRNIKIQEEKRLDLVRESQKSIKVLEKLKEKQYTEYLEKIKKEDERMLEELVSQKHIREQDGNYE